MGTRMRGQFVTEGMRDEYDKYDAIEVENHAQSSGKSGCYCGPTPQLSIKLSGEVFDRDLEEDLHWGVLC